MSAVDEKLIEVVDVVAEYGRGRKCLRAVDGISFQVRRGECVGFIGPNGAGKSTTIKALLGFVFPTAGSVRVFGLPGGTVESRRRLGYLPEVALYYPFMKARELLKLYGGLQGLTNEQLKSRIPEVLEDVGLAGRGDTLLKNYSKGMQQRLGIAQAIIARPELLIFDELSSGLDPLARYDLRRLLQRLLQEGTTIFFSSHELTEVEELCDRVIAIHKGRIVAESAVSDLMKPLNSFEIEFECDGRLPEAVGRFSPARTRTDDAWQVLIHGVDEYRAALEALVAAKARIRRTESQSRSLEQYFIDLIREQELSPAKA